MQWSATMTQGQVWLFVFQLDHDLGSNLGHASESGRLLKPGNMAFQTTSPLGH